MNATSAEMLVDYWAHRHWDDPKLRDEDVNEDFEADLAEMDAVPVDDGEWETVAKDGEP